MFINKKKIYISAGIIIVIFVGYFFLTPDFNSAITRVYAFDATLGNNSVIATYKFVEESERIRGKYELAGKMNSERAAQRDDAVKNLLLTRNDSGELLVYLRIYGKAMYLSSEGMGTYQVIFFSVLRKLADNADNDPNLKQHLLKIKDEFNLMGMDSGEYSSIVEHQPFP